MYIDKERAKNREKTLFDKVIVGGWLHYTIWVISGLLGVGGFFFLLSLVVGE